MTTLNRLTNTIMLPVETGAEQHLWDLAFVRALRLDAQLNRINREQIMPVRMRATISATGDRSGELRTAANLRRDLWAHSPVEVDPDHPLLGTHRDEGGRVYFEFATAFPDEVRRVVHQYHYTDSVELTETPSLPGEECVNCGNVAGPVRPVTCPNCGFQDVSPCPICGENVPRQLYTRISGDLFRCPHCKNKVRLRFNNPMLLLDGTYNQPLVVVEEAATVYEVRSTGTRDLDTHYDRTNRFASSGGPVQDKLLAYGLCILGSDRPQNVNKLPDIFRQVVVLLYYCGLKYREVADLLGVPVGTVMLRLNRALIELQKMWTNPHSLPEI